MAKPRIFVSSTYYDLKHIRDRLESFVESFGYEPVLFESGDIPFRHDVALDESCYAEIKSCHILILVIGGRYGSPASADKKLLADKELQSEFYNSITKSEYQSARERDIPIFIFVDKSVLAEYETFKQNRTNASITYAHVDHINVFRLLDEILSRDTNNFIRGFERFDDISHWLREQWAGLFADFISRRSSEATLKDLSVKITELGQVTGALKDYSEALIRKIQPDDSERIIDAQHRKLAEGRIEAFGNEPMIRYLIKEASERNVAPKVTAATAFAAFRDSDNVEEFVRLLGFSDEYVVSLMKSHEVPARRDYAKLGTRYFDRPEIAPLVPPGGDDDGVLPSANMVSDGKKRRRAARKRNTD